MIRRAVCIAAFVIVLFARGRMPAAQDGVKEYSIVITQPDVNTPWMSAEQ